MPTFVWKGRTMAGETQAGEVSFERQEEALDFLRKKRILVTSLKEKSKGFKFALPEGGVSTKEMAIFTRQFATMISAGLPLVQCLDILASQTSKPSFAKVISDVTREVEAGSTLADALSKNKKVFDDLFRNMIAAGEAGGILDDILMRLAQYIEKADALKRKVQGAMIYPAVVLTFATLVMTGMLMFLVPIFVKIFDQLGGELPTLTQYVMHASNALRNPLIPGLPIPGVVFFSGFAIGFFVWFRRWKKTEGGRERWDKFKLRIPMQIGIVVRKVAMARWSRTLSTLIASGVDIMRALEITAQTAGNWVVEEETIALRHRVEEGSSIAQPLIESVVFPPMIAQMVKIGEETGELEKMLSKVADFYEDEVDASIAALTSIIEPMMMVGVGVMVGIIIISMYLPMFKLLSLVK
jgi:type IV pilus assembly protein PilC